MNFDEQVRIIQALTSSKKQLDSALNRLEPDDFRMPARTSGAAFSPDGRSTALFDAIYVASEAVLKNQKGRKALIVISDGMDVKSENTLDAAIAAAQKADTLVFAIHIYDNAIPTLGLGLSGGAADPQAGVLPPSWAKATKQELSEGKAALQRAARETGGTFFEITNEMPLASIYGRVEDELRSEYSLGYSHDDADLKEGYHKLRVTTTQGGLTVQARDGYYAEAR